MLLHSWGNFNKVTTLEAGTTTKTERVNGTWKWYPYPWQEITVTEATMTTVNERGSFEYVGMDKETAQECAEAMIDEYTVDFKWSKWNKTTGKFDKETGGQICKAKVSVCNVGNRMYNVRVDINYGYSLLS